MLAGLSVAYGRRVDLRVTFQMACGTHPRTEEPQYRVVLGLAQGGLMMREEVMLRYNT